MQMQGHTILVAGGARGIGRGLAELLCRLGNEVLIFDAEPRAAQAAARAHPGLRAVELDLADPWSVAGFAEQVAASCPGLNMLVNVSIAFPVRHLPGLEALLDGDDTHQQLEAYRLGLQHLTGALLPHFRKRAHSSVLNVSVGPVLAPMPARRGAAPALPGIEGAAHACVMSARKRWASACIEVVDIAVPSRAERVGLAHGLPRAQFLSRLAQLLAEGLHEEAALERLRALWPQAQSAAPRRTRDDDLLSAMH